MWFCPSEGKCSDMISPGPTMTLLIKSDGALGYKKSPILKPSLLWVFLTIFAWFPCAFVIIWEWESYFKFHFISFKCDKYKYRNKAAYVNNRDVWNYRIFAFLQKPRVDSISSDRNYFFHPQIITQHKNLPVFVYLWMENHIGNTDCLLRIYMLWVVSCSLVTQNPLKGTSASSHHCCPD